MAAAHGSMDVSIGMIRGLHNESPAITVFLASNYSYKHVGIGIS